MRLFSYLFGSLILVSTACSDPRASTSGARQQLGGGGAASGGGFTSNGQAGQTAAAGPNAGVGEGNMGIFVDPEAEAAAANAASMAAAPIGCGNGELTEDEACDDGNVLGGDGCAANCLSVESGFSCAVPGAACLVIARCGDGIVAPSELCDDGAKVAGDGCSETCKIEKGMKCAGVPSVCSPATCGDGMREGAEGCDDGNVRAFDGCSSDCEREPICPGAGGACMSECGDGMVINEGCDDGNTISGDGCSATCTVEPGFMCSQPVQPCEELNGDCILRVPAVFRDHSQDHPDFGPRSGECEYDVTTDAKGVETVPGNILTTGLVQETLGADGRPQLNGGEGTQECGVTTEATDYVQVGALSTDSYVGITQFGDWFTDAGNSVVVPGEIVLFDNGSGGFVNRFGDDGEKFEGYENEIYEDGGGLVCSWCLDGSCEDPCSADDAEFDGDPLFFPVDSVTTGATADLERAKVPGPYGYTGWPFEEDVFAGAGDHNFYFTSEVQTWFEYTADMDAELEFTGDDDVWVFVNGQLAVDLGGIHAPEDGSVTINSGTAARYNLAEGQVYSLVVFQAERRVEGSSFRLTLSGFENTPSDCSADCGDGIVSFGEECDDGVNDGGYGECTAGCVLGSFCGDGVVEGPEQCDPAPGTPVGDCVACRVLVFK